MIPTGIDLLVTHGPPHGILRRDNVYRRVRQEREAVTRNGSSLYFIWLNNQYIIYLTNRTIT